MLFTGTVRPILRAFYVGTHLYRLQCCTKIYLIGHFCGFSKRDAGTKQCMWVAGAKKESFVIKMGEVYVVRMYVS